VEKCVTAGQTTDDCIIRRRKDAEIQKHSD